VEESGEHQTGCAKCEALRMKTQIECESRIRKAYQDLYARLEEIQLEHDRGEHDD
jgi:hypothetical protein